MPWLPDSYILTGRHGGKETLSSAKEQTKTLETSGGAHKHVVIKVHHCSESQKKKSSIVIHFARKRATMNKRRRHFMRWERVICSRLSFSPKKENDQQINERWTLTESKTLFDDNTAKCPRKSRSKVHACYRLTCNEPRPVSHSPDCPPAAQHTL